MKLVQVLIETQLSLQPLLLPNATGDLFYLYNALNERDMIMGLIEDRHEDLKKALELEMLGDYSEVSSELPS